MVSLSLLAAGPVPSCLAAAETDTASPEQALDIFFQLGLPDARGATWMKVYGPGVSYGEPLPGGNYSGNAWLVREETDGRVELILTNGRRLIGRTSRARVAADGSAAASLPQYHIQAANLDRDLKIFATALQEKELDVALAKPRYGGSDDVRQQVGGAVLFLAQLHRQGRANDIRPLLSDLLARQQSPDLLVDCAISLLANARVAQSTEEWTRRGESEAYAQALEKLSAEFPRGWENRDAVQLLINRVRDQKPAPAVTRPEVKNAADLFLSLTPEQFRKLPRGDNWLLGSDSNGTEESFEEGDSLKSDEATPDTPAARPADPLQAFFQQKRKGAEILASLVEDGRFMRISGDMDPVHRRYHFSFDQTPEEKLRAAYDQLARPKTVGEVAWALLEPLIQDRSKYGSDEDFSTRSARASAWLEEIRALSEEELAWQYLRASSSPHDPHFRKSLAYLVQHGGEDTQRKLQEVFLDPAVWPRGHVDSIVPILEPYLKRMAENGDGVDAFGEKLKAVITQASKEDDNPIPGIQIDAESRKRMAAEQSAQLRKLDQLLKPRGFKEILAELNAATTPEETEAAMAVIGTAAQTTPWSELEPALYQAAAAAKESQIKRQLLMLLQMTLFRQLRGNKSSLETGQPPSDPATRAALKQLLEDDTPPAEDAPYGGAPQSISDLTASGLVFFRLPIEEQQSWTALWQQSPDIAKIALKTHALALTSGQTPPAAPNAETVAAEEVKKIVEELSALPSTKVIEALRAKTLDQQLAVILHLKDVPKWPKALHEAHFTIVSVHASDEKAAVFNSDTWRGRTLDEATRREIEAAVVKASLERNPLLIRLASQGPLSGLTLTARPNIQESSAEMLNAMLPGLDGKPAPVAAVFQVLQLGMVPSRGDYAAFAIPLWSDSALTEAWKKEHLKPEVAPSAAANSGTEAEPNNEQINPQLFAKRMSELHALKAGMRGPFTLQWQATNFTQSPNAAEDDEP